MLIKNSLQTSIRRARKLYCNDSFGIELNSTAYALNTMTNDFCLSLFPWAPFRSTNAAVRMHTLLDLCGNSDGLRITT
jgi:hypothetical protein